MLLGLAISDIGFRKLSIIRTEYIISNKKIYKKY